MQPTDASVVLAPYLEPVIRGRRVAVLGDATDPLGSALLERGARLVHVYDPDASRVAEVLARQGASRTLMTAPLPDGELAVRDGAFDTVVVPNLVLFDPVDTVVARARKLVAAHGYAVFVSPNPDRTASSVERQLSYYELYDLIALQFPEVRMLGQAPFSGYLIADFAPEGDPDVVVDTSLVDRKDQEPKWFVALGTQQARRLDPFTIIQVPGDLAPVAGDEAVTNALQQEVQSLKKELEQTRSQAASLPIVPRVQPRNERVEALEASLREKEEELRRVELRAGDNHVRAGRLENKVRDLEEELRHQRDRAFRLSNDLEEEKKSHTKAELELRMIRSRADMPPVQEGASKVEIDRLRAALGQAETQVATLQSENSTLRDRLTDAEKQGLFLRDSLEDIRTEKLQVEKHVVDLQRALAEKEARIDELDALVVDLQEASGDPELERELDRTRRELADLQASFDASLQSKLSEVAKLVRERDDARARAEQVRLDKEHRLVSVAQERDTARASLQASLEKSADLEAALHTLREQLSALQSAASQQHDQTLVEMTQRRDEAVAMLESLRQQQEQEVEALEHTLRERGQEIQRLQSDVMHHELLVRELVQRLPEVSQAEAQGVTDARRDTWLEESARREGELQQARWKVAELEQRLRDQEERTEVSTEVAELERALFAAQNELDAMRQALATRPAVPADMAGSGQVPQEK